MKPAIRRYRKDDYASLWACVDSVCREEPWMKTQRFEPDRNWRHALMEPECPFHLLLVADVGGDIGGWCRLFPVQCASGNDSIELGIGVQRRWQHQGLGNLLLARAKEWAGVAGYNKITLFVSKNNDIARNFYQKHGFLCLDRQYNGLETMTLRLPYPESTQVMGNMTHTW